ncbi:MAG: sigma-70 family RNA polymerase sigma factor [Bacteroidota bacterium]
MSTDTIAQQIDQLYRQHAGALMTSLVSYFNLSNLSLAEDIVQNTFVAALENWSTQGIPEQPKAWLFRVCKNKALNHLKRQQHFRDQVLPNTQTATAPEISGRVFAKLDNAFLDYEIKDNQLRLLFAISHPDFAPKSSIILTLKTLAGFRLQEIASGLGMQTEAVKKNLQRTRQQIRKNNMPLRVPFLLQSKKRLQRVHQVLYLMFNESYHSNTGTAVIRHELCVQALRLTRALLDEPRIATADTRALFALMLFNVARFHARLNEQNQLVELAQQNRQLWDAALIDEAIRHFNRSRKSDHWSRYHYEAGIASLHCTATTFDTTNWKAIVQLYDQLYQLQPNPFVQLNRCIALHYAGQTRQALQTLQKLKALGTNALYWTTLGELHAQLAEKEKAIDHFLTALQFATTDVAKAGIKRKIDRIQ